MADLKLTNVEKTYGGSVNVLNNINLDIKTGELIVFVGPSGCGKSTLLRMIAGLEKITGGELEIDGEEMNDIPPAQRGIAMVFQSYALYPHMTVRENMSFALKIAKKSKAEIDEAVDPPRPKSCSWNPIWIACPRRCQVGSVSGWRLAAPSCAIPRSICLTNRFPTSTRPCGWRRGSRSPA